MRKLIVILVLGLTAVGSVAAGCGSDDDADAEQIDKATFVKRANAICEKESGQLAAEANSIVVRESAKPSYDREKTQLVLVKESLVPSLEAELEEIRALGVPPEVKKEAQAFFRAFEKVIDRAKSDPEGFNQSFSPYEVAEVAGTRFGVSECPIAPVSPS